MTNPRHQRNNLLNLGKSVARASRRNYRNPAPHESHEIELLLEAPAHGGYCIAHAQGKTYFVRGGIPGERVLARSYRQRGKLLFARVTQVLRAAPERIYEPNDLAHDQGADLLHLGGVGQLVWKQLVLQDCWQRIGSRELGKHFARVQEAGEIQAARLPSSTGRIRAEFVVDVHRKLGMYRQGTNELAPAQNFPLLESELRSHPIFSAPQWAKMLEPKMRVRLLAAAEGIYAKIGEQWFDLDRKKVILPVIHYDVKTPTTEHRFCADPNGFWQVNRGADALLVQVFRELLAGIATPQLILELFAGAGLLTWELQRLFPQAQVLALEGAATAVELGRKNVPQAHFEAIYIDSDSVEHLAGLHLRRAKTDKLEKQIAPQKPLLVVADPPRQGLGQDLITAITDLEPQHIVLFSCDPAASAADAKGLCEMGYIPLKIRLVDIFPNTHHFETVALYVRHS